MKRKFSKILGVGLTLALLTSLLLTAAPVMANVSQPTVDIDVDEISEVGVYTLSFRINDTLDQGETITVRFPDDTDASGAAVAGGGVSYTSGIGFDSGASTAIGVAVDPDDPIVTITLTTLPNSIGAMAYVQVVISGIINPTEPGTYTLEVQTEIEDTYVTSESYDIDVPVVGGFVYVYNPSNILMATFGGSSALVDAAGYYDDADFSIVVGPGTYVLAAATLTLSGEGLTFESSDGADDTIIDASAVTRPAFHITADDVIFEGFTLDGSKEDGIYIQQGADDVIIQNNIFFEGDWSSIVLEAVSGGVVVTGATIADNVFEDNYTAITILGGATDNTISGNTITGSTDTITAITFGGGPTASPTQGNAITGNTISDNAGTGIWLFEWASEGFFDDNEISGNTISGNAGDGIFMAATADDVTELQILDNIITDNEGDGILLNNWATTGGVISNVIKFNTITGNEGDDLVNASDDAVDATFNWWGTTVADDILVSDTGNGTTTYEPFLTATAEATILGGKAAADTSSLDAKTAAGVKVSGVEDDTGGTTHQADIISAVKFTANPEGVLADAIAFYDVYVVLGSAIVLDEVAAKVKFYDSAITTGSVAHFWTGDFWAEASDQEARDGIIYVTITEDTLPALDELTETIFAVVAGEAVEEDAQVWECSEGLTFDSREALELHLATAAAHQPVEPIVVVVEEPEPEPEVWMCSEGLTFDSREALETHLATAAAHQPVEPAELPDIVLEPADIILEAPDIIVPLPAVTPITPAWIYVIIGVGAVLVIALLVLIVRTRRVA